jgi:hypothetical protein
MAATLRHNWYSLGVLALAIGLFAARAPGPEHYIENFDHGVQLCTATQVLFGKVPGRDMLISGGPLAGYTSALGLWLSGSLVGESLICSVGYGLSLWIIWLLASRYTTNLAGAVTSMFAFLLSARFYKWYVWLFPLAMLWILDRYGRTAPERRLRWSILAGVMLGIEWLYRFDLATTGLAASVLFIGLIEWRRPRVAVRESLLLVVAFAVPVLAWFAFLAIPDGVQACRAFLAMTRDGAASVTRDMAMPLPPFLLTEPLSSSSILVLAYIAVPFTYVLCVTVGVYGEIRKSEGIPSRTLLAIALIGLSLLHQAMHRRDAPHLLQVLPPALLGASLLVGLALRGPWFAQPPSLRVRLLRLASLSYLVLVVTIGLGLIQWGSVDLGRFSFGVGRRWAGLADPLGEGNQHPIAPVLREVRRRTDPSQSILVFPLISQYYTLVGRRVSGSVYAYWPGIFSQPRWSNRNLAAISRDPPELVIVSTDLLPPTLSPPDLRQAARASHAGVDEFIRRQYTKVVCEGGGLLVLERGP